MRPRRLPAAVAESCIEEIWGAAAHWCNSGDGLHAPCHLAPPLRRGAPSVRAAWLHPRTDHNDFMEQHRPLLDGMYNTPRPGTEKERIVKTARGVRSPRCCRSGGP